MCYALPLLGFVQANGTDGQRKWSEYAGATLSALCGKKFIMGPYLHKIGIGTLGDSG